MKELCILYHYHKVDPLTVQHLELIKQHNPDAIVIPVTNDVSEYLPDSVDVKNFPAKWDTSNKWRSLDTTFYLWFLNRDVSAERYLILEYDCRCTMPIKEAYAAVWDAEFSCRSLYTPKNKPGWFWFKPEELARLEPEDRIYAGGVVPYAGTFMSHAGAEKMIECLTPNDVFCELRLGTAVRKAGLNVVLFSGNLKKTIHADTVQFDLNQPGVYHPVKEREVHKRNLEKTLRMRKEEASLLNRFRRLRKQTKSFFKLK